MHIASIGIDLGKTTFHLVALGEGNKIQRDIGGFDHRVNGNALAHAADY